jgi:chromate transporter
VQTVREHTASGALSRGPAGDYNAADASRCANIPGMIDAMSGTATQPPSVAPSTRELFGAFLKVGLSGFGGVMPFARRMLIEQKYWLTEEEFIDVLSLSQFLPGPNIVNVAIIVGRRFQGLAGSAAASLGLMLMPFIIILLLAATYARFAQYDAVRGACNGISAAASGLVLTTGLKMARPLRRVPWQAGVGLIAFAVIGLARLPLLWAVLGLLPLSIATAWWRR